MENMDKELTVPKWLPLVWPENDQFICPSPKVLKFNEKRLHWASVVRGASIIACNSRALIRRNKTDELA